MSMVRIVRTDGQAASYSNQMELSRWCRRVRAGLYRRDGYWRAEFVEPVPLYRVYTYDSYDSIGGGHYIEPRPMPLAYALALATDTRERDRRCGIDNWRTVVRAAR